MQPTRSIAAALGLGLLLCAGCGGGEGGVDAVAVRASDAGLPAPVDAGPPDLGPPRHAYAKRYVVNVRQAPAPRAFRIGYLRAGAVVDTTTSTPVGHDGCIRGWYELVTGGFVCDGRDVQLFDGRRPPERPPTQPDRTATLPYEYMINRRDGTPVYRRLPTDEEAAQYEGYVIPGAPPADAGAVGGAEGSESGEAAMPVGGGSESGEAGAVAAERPAEPSAATQTVRDIAAANAPTGEGEEAGEEPLVPTLDSLRGDRESVLMRRLVKGFYLSVDREMRTRGRRYYRTLSAGFVPWARLGPARPSEFHGVQLDGTEMALPLGYLLSSKAHSFRRGPDGRLRRAGDPGYHHVFRMTGEEVIQGRTYVLGADDRLYESEDVTRIELRAPPRDVNVEANEKWVDVNLERQFIVAYEGARPVFATLISSGRILIEDDPLNDHRTPTGNFRITSKHIAATMDGDHAVDGPYSIEDVPYVMYFELANALHSAFWHNRFGRTKSHGCVNMAPLDARWMFEWSDPPVPRGWHGAYPTPERPGTRLYIHGEAPRG